MQIIWLPDVYLANHQFHDHNQLRGIWRDFIKTIIKLDSSAFEWK